MVESLWRYLFNSTTNGRRYSILWREANTEL